MRKQDLSKPWENAFQSETTAKELLIKAADFFDALYYCLAAVAEECLLKYIPIRKH